jgi:hypothetical protein
MARCNCNSNTCNCFVSPGNGIDVTGDGSEASPFVVAVESDIDAAPAQIAAHIADSTDAHSATAIQFTPTGSIAATNAQAAIVEVSNERAADLAAHLADTSDAHDASAISVADAGGLLVATDVEAALAELAALANPIIVAGAAQMLALSGSPVVGVVNTNAIACWLMDAATTEIVGGMIRLPGWNSFNAQIIWAPSTTGAGDVRWEWRRTTLTAGALPTVSGATTFVSTAPGVAEQVVVTAASASVSLASLGSYHGFRISRTGGDAADTYAADAKLIGIIFNRLT